MTNKVPDDKLMQEQLRDELPGSSVQVIEGTQQGRIKVEIKAEIPSTNPVKVTLRVGGTSWHQAKEKIEKSINDMKACLAQSKQVPNILCWRTQQSQTEEVKLLKQSPEGDTRIQEETKDNQSLTKEIKLLKQSLKKQQQESEHNEQLWGKERSSLIREIHDVKSDMDSEEHAWTEKERQLGLQLEKLNARIKNERITQLSLMEDIQLLKNSLKKQQQESEHNKRLWGKERSSLIQEIHDVKTDMDSKVHAWTVKERQLGSQLEERNAHIKNENVTQLSLMEDIKLLKNSLKKEKQESEHNEQLWRKKESSLTQEIHDVKTDMSLKEHVWTEKERLLGSKLEELNAHIKNEKITQLSLMEDIKLLKNSLKKEKQESEHNKQLWGKKESSLSEEIHDVKTDMSLKEHVWTEKESLLGSKLEELNAHIKNEKITQLSLMEDIKLLKNSLKKEKQESEHNEQLWRKEESSLRQKIHDVKTTMNLREHAWTEKEQSSPFASALYHDGSVQGPQGPSFPTREQDPNYVILLASSDCALEFSLDRFAAACGAAGMRIGTSKSEAMVLSRKRLGSTLQVGEET
ncbi:uncharacterized protein [Brachionichthys hirsutus]|uniref:uncharacterized protein n=1 Tax=Brachionichthys hirsutus TaxID=412623 RepID=UPI0036050443